MAGNLVISQINGGPIGVINAIINGNYQVNQRGVSGTVTLTAGDYGHDRWKAGASGCTYTFATANNVTTLTITAGSLIQVIEGLNLYSGTYVLSFTGTAQGKIGAGSFAASGVTGTAVGGTNLNIEFNTGTVSLVQFEPGSEVSPFERRPIGTELALCQRYFETYGGETAFNPIATAFVFSTTQSVAPVIFNTVKRASPTLTISSASNWEVLSSVGSGIALTSLAFTGSGNQVTTKSCLLRCTVASGLSAGNASFLESNTISARLNFSAEL